MLYKNIKKTSMEDMAREILCEAAKQKLLNGEPIGWGINYVAGEIRHLFYRFYIESQFSALRDERLDAGTIARKIFANLYERGHFDARARMVADALNKILA